jgi:hypothetical protein
MPASGQSRHDKTLKPGSSYLEVYGSRMQVFCRSSSHTCDLSDQDGHPNVSRFVKERMSGEMCFESYVSHKGCLGNSTLSYAVHWWLVCTICKHAEPSATLPWVTTLQISGHEACQQADTKDCSGRFGIVLSQCWDVPGLRCEAAASAWNQPVLSNRPARFCLRSRNNDESDSKKTYCGDCQHKH